MDITKLFVERGLCSDTGNPAVTLIFISQEMARRMGKEGKPKDAVLIYRKLTNAAFTPVEIKRGRTKPLCLSPAEKEVFEKVLSDLAVALIQIGAAVRNEK